MTKKGSKKKVKESGEYQMWKSSQAPGHKLNSKTPRTSQEFLSNSNGVIYQMIRDRDILDVGLEEMIIYQNIRKSDITKAATCPEIFPCSEVIGWILP